MVKNGDIARDAYVGMLFKRRMNGFVKVITVCGGAGSRIS